MLVHHGLFWRGYEGRITGWLKQRIARLLAHDISLYAYHLPLDAHAELGNNAQFGARLGITADARFGEQSLGFIGTLSMPSTVDDLAARCERLSGPLDHIDRRRWSHRGTRRLVHGWRPVVFRICHRCGR